MYGPGIAEEFASSLEFLIKEMKAVFIKYRLKCIYKG